MKIIKELSELIEEEVEGAENYAKLANSYKVDRPKLADVFYELSLQEMHHVNRLHEEVVKMIKEHRQAHGEPPAAMMAIYEWQHKRQTDKMAEVKRYQDIFMNS